MLIERPLAVIVIIIANYDDYYYKPLPNIPSIVTEIIQNQYVLLSFDVISIFLWFSLLSLIILKFYLLYYNQQLNLSVINEAWQKEINIGVSDWYIVNKNSKGNSKWLIKVVITPYLLCVIALVVLSDLFIVKRSSNPGQLNLGINFLIILFLSIMLIICIFVGFYIRLQTRLLSDIYKIRQQIKYEMFLLVFFVLATIADCLLVYSNWFSFLKFINLSDFYTIIGNLIYVACSQIFVTGLTYFTIVYPIRLFVKDLNDSRRGRMHSININNSNGRRSISLTLSRTTNHKHNKHNKHNSKNDKNETSHGSDKLKYDLTQFISTEAGFFLFMQFLASEFSTG